jgi:hypothetical protein
LPRCVARRNLAGQIHSARTAKAAPHDYFWILHANGLPPSLVLAQTKWRSVLPCPTLTDELSLDLRLAAIEWRNTP